MFRLLAIPLALVALLAGAVVWSNTSQGKPADFTFVERGDNKTLDIGVMSWMQDIRLAYALWEGLYTPDPVTLKPIPGSADRIDISDDKTVYNFHIRDNARWTNGEPLTAKDFAFGWRRMIEQPGEYTYLLYYLKGAEDYGNAYAEWKKQIGEWHKGRMKGPKPPRPQFAVGVEATGDKTLKVTLAHPLPIFPSLCAFPCYFPQYEPCMRPFEQWDEKDVHTYVSAYDETFTRPPHLVTNGPYRLAEWSFKRRVRLEASEYYWNRPSVKSKIVDQIFSDDPLAAFRIYESGQADWIETVDADVAADLAKVGRKDIKLFPAFGTYFYDFNCNPTLKDGRKNPFHDRRVRRAFCMAVDKRPIVENVTRTGERPTTNFIPRGVFADYVSPPGLAYNVQEARRLLAEAGYPNGEGFPRLTILFNNDFPQHAEVAQVVRRQWQQNLGVDSALEGVEIKIFGDRMNKHEFAIGRGSWYGDYDDPSTFTDVYRSSSENNNPDWRRKDFDALLDQANLEKDAHRRLKYFEQAENMMLEDAPIMPLFQYVGRYLIRDNVHGIPLDPRQMIMMQAVQVDHGK